MSDPNKKRGRPRKSLDSAAEPSAMDETSKSRKRGRPAKTQDAQPPAGVDAEEQRPRKRTKPAAAEDNTAEPVQSMRLEKAKVNASRKAAEADGADGPADNSTRRSARDRRSADDNPWWAPKPSAPSPPVKNPEKPAQPSSQTSKTAQSASGGRGEKAGRKPSAPKPPPEQPPSEQPPRDDSQLVVKSSKPSKALAAAEGEPAVRRSARDRRSADDNPWWSSQAGEGSSKDAQPEKAASGPPKKGRGRASLGEVSVSQVQNQTPQGHDEAENAPAAKKSGSNAQRTARPTAPPSEKGQRRSSGGAPTSRPKGRRSRSDQDDNSALDPPAAPQAKYCHLASRTRQIPRSTISSKWTPLDDGAIAAVDSIVADTSRPVLFRLRDRDQRHQQAQNILRTFAKRLHSKLLKGIPFPPPSTGVTGRGTATTASHEAEFDFERTVDATQALEKTLDPLLHSVALLAAEKEREEEALDREYRLLKTLETNARAEIRGWREREKRDHALAPVPRATNPGGDNLEDTQIATTGGPAVSGIFQVSCLRLWLHSRQKRSGRRHDD